MWLNIDFSFVAKNIFKDLQRLMRITVPSQRVSMNVSDKIAKI